MVCSTCADTSKGTRVHYATGRGRGNRRYIRTMKSSRSLCNVGAEENGGTDESDKEKTVVQTNRTKETCP